MAYLFGNLIGVFLGMCLLGFRIVLYVFLLINPIFWIIMLFYHPKENPKATEEEKSAQEEMDKRALKLFGLWKEPEAPQPPIVLSKYYQQVDYERLRM